MYSTGDIAFILERCLWFNQEKFIDFFVFQTATLRLSSRAAETSRLSFYNLSVRELYEAILSVIRMGLTIATPLFPTKMAFLVILWSLLVWPCLSVVKHS